MSLCARCQANYDEDQINTEPTILAGGGWCAPAEYLASSIFHEPSCDPVELWPYRWHLQTRGHRPLRAFRAWKENKAEVESGAIAHGYAGRLRDSLPEIKVSRGGIKYERIRLEEID